MQGPWLEPLRSEPETKGEPLGLSSHSPRLPGDRHSGSPRGRGWGACWPPRRPLRSGLVRSAQGTAPGGDEVSEPRGKNVSLTPGGRAGGGHRFCDGSCSLTAQGSGGDLPAAGCPKAPGRGIRSSEVAGSEPAASWLHTPGAAPGGGPRIPREPTPSLAALTRSQGRRAARVRTSRGPMPGSSCRAGRGHGACGPGRGARPPG